MHAALNCFLFYLSRFIAFQHEQSALNASASSDSSDARNIQLRVECQRVTRVLWSLLFQMISVRIHERELLSSRALNETAQQNPVHTILRMHEQLFSLVNHSEKDFDKEKILKEVEGIIQQTTIALSKTIQAVVGYISPLTILCISPLNRQLNLRVLKINTCISTCTCLYVHCAIWSK